MKTFIRGNTALVQTAIPAEEYAKYRKFGVFTVCDEEGDAVYAVEKSNFGTSALNEFSITCNTEYQGMLAASVIFEDIPADKFAEAIKPALVALRDNELKILAAISDLEVKLASVNDDIIVE